MNEQRDDRGAMPLVGPHANHLHFTPDRTIQVSASPVLNLYRLDALSDA